MERFCHVGRLPDEAGDHACDVTPGIRGWGLAEGLISHEELLAKFRERDVTLLVLSPEIYQIWGTRMEENWIASMRWFAASP